MKILCHRGFWKKKSEQNTLNSFESALIQKFGIEIDIRDFNNEIVISHDAPNKNSPKLKALLDIGLHHDLPLAFNIKSDGITKELAKIIENFKVSNYFCFDMSIPQQLSYQTMGLTWYSRLSDHIEEQVINKNAQGIWLDSFFNEWWNKDDLAKLSVKKHIAIVSPELHGRDHRSAWEQIKGLRDKKNIILCTDFPNEAQDFFYD